MELTAYIRLLRRWLWLIILAAVVAGSVSFVLARTQPAIYRASVTLQVGKYMDLANPNASMIQTGEQLAQTYSALLKTYPVLEATVNKLQLPFSPDRLSALFNDRLTAGTSLMTITVTYTDPVVVADIANELAQQLIVNSPTNLTKDQQQQLDLLQGEVNTIRTQLEDGRAELSAVEAGLKSATGDDRDILLSRQKELLDQITMSQSNLAQMSSTVATLQQQGNINSLTIIEAARIPDQPSDPATFANTLVAALLAGVAAAGVGFAIEYLNDSIRVPSEVMPLLNVAPIGIIAPFGKKRTYNDKLIAWTQPRSTIAEAYRALRVNLMYADSSNGSHSDARVFAITSPGPSEGKSVTAANIAVTFAITGMRVLLVDADMRRPVQHLLFGLPNNTGLSNLWNNNGPIRAETSSRSSNSDAPGEVLVRDEAILKQKVALALPYLTQKTSVPGLELMTAGPVPNNPAELLGTPQIFEMLHQLTVNHGYDVVIFDTPPVLLVSDTTVLANVSKAGVIMVVEAGRTRRGAAVRAVQQLATLSVQPLGVVMNRMHPRDADAGYGQYYYYGYYGYSQPPSQAPNPGQNGQGASSGVAIQK